MSFISNSLFKSASKMQNFSKSSKIIQYVRIDFRPFYKTITFSTKNNSSSDKQFSEKLENFKQSNPYFSKYESKLKAIYEEDPEAFLKSINNKKYEKIGNGYDLNDLNSQIIHSLTKKKKLESVLKMELVNDLDSKEIERIWITYMNEKNGIAGILSPDDFKNVFRRSHEFKTFIFALPRQEGYEFFLSQWSSHECHFTSLINYQAHGENSPSILSITYFDELSESKNVILEMVEFDHKSLKVEEAKFLINQMKLYYLKSNEEDTKYKLIYRFNKSPSDFKHMDIIKQIELDNLSVKQFKD